LHQGHCGAGYALDVIVTRYGICQPHEVILLLFTGAAGVEEWEIRIEAHPAT
jgi:hypothetical protein